MNSSKNINKNEMNKKSSTMRLVAYMKPYAHWVIFALLLVLGLTAFDLYRPMLGEMQLILLEQMGIMM